MAPDSPSAPSLPPRAAQRPSSLSHHGVARLDPYAWLRDEHWQAVMRDPEVLDPEIRTHLEAENAYTEAILAPVAELRETLFEELKGRIPQRDDSVPEKDGPYAYFTRYEEGGQHPVICRRRLAGGPDEVLLDGNHEAVGKAFFELRACEHAPDHRHLAYAVDETGSEYCEVFFKDLETGAVLPERLRDASAALAWCNDSRSLLYVVLDENHRPWRVYRHRLKSDPAEDALVYEERDPGFFLSVGRTESRRFLTIDAHDHTTSETHLLDAESGEGPLMLVAARSPDLRYEVSHDAEGDRLLLRTNAGGAEDFKLVEAPVPSAEAPGDPSAWRDLLPHAPGRYRLSMLAFRAHLVLLERVEGLPRIAVHRLDAKNLETSAHAVAFEEAAYSLGLAPGFEYDSATLRFVYSSMTTPPRTYDYDMDSRERVLLKEQVVPSGHDPALYISERLMAPSHDGAEVPISLVYRRDLDLSQGAPVLLYGYGSYGMAIPAGFQPNRFSLIDWGFVYAIAHVRGGADKGWAWYREGKLAAKTNTFQDFVAAARFLEDRGTAAPGGTAIQGGSAGGLLVGAALNLAPELFKAAVAEVPFVDVLNTMCDDTLPLTPPEWPEWGNPITDKEAFERIASYSPYDNVTARDYPHILVTAGLTDPRVTYWEPAKWVAKLRALKTDENLLLLKTTMDAGHAGASGRFDKLKEVALVQAFLLLVLGKA